jgi:pimeloyl-ACP methyl ester carboxylesterase
MHKFPPNNWILLRGLGREAAHWGAFLDELQQTFPQATIHTLDLPGSGRLHRQTSPSQIEKLVDCARQQAESEGLLNQPAILLGLSLGGMVAWQWLFQYPQDVTAAVLINSSFASLNRFYQRLRWQSYSKLAGIITAQSDAERERRILALVSNQDEQARGVLTRQWTAIRQQRPMSASNEINQILAAARFKPKPEKPEQPVLLLNSLGDRLVSPDCSATISRHYHLPLLTHPSAGHDLPNDASEWVTQQLRIWLESLAKN